MSRNELLMVLLLAPLGTMAQDAFLNEYIERMESSKQYFVEMIAALEDEAHLDGWTPADGAMTFRQQITHTLRTVAKHTEVYIGAQPYGPMDWESLNKDDLIMEVKSVFDYAITHFQTLETQDLDTIVGFFAGPKTKRQVLQIMADHITHHRGQMVVYLRLLGYQPPRYKAW